MKKLILIALTLSAVSLSACTDWDRSNPEMPEGLKQQHEDRLNQSLEVLKTDPNDVSALFNIGFQYQELGDYKSAVEYYKKDLALEPNNTVTLNNIADIYEQVELYDQAATYIKQLYSLSPVDVEVIRDTVRILLKDENPGQAQEALENFARNADSTQEGVSLLISDLYQSIVDYRKAHGEQ